jgi:3-oxosteroid 1-dehydrogenase
MRRADEEFDFVIVGSGGGSMCAALFMRSLGKSVLILEKTDLVGGTTARSGGVMWIPNNRFMAEAGVPDSYQKAMDYMEATVGHSPDAPGTSAERRSTYVIEGAKMVDFLVAQGVRLRRVECWPDYYDERPGGSVPGRTVVADIFDINELGAWRDRLRTNYMKLPVYYDEAFEIATVKSSFKGKMEMLKVGLRAALSRLQGKRLVTFGAALQGRMLQAALRAGADVRVNTAVRYFDVENNRVAGVVVGSEDTQSRIRARYGVLVNAGGFSQNQPMRDQYAPGTSARWTGAGPGDTGEMIREMIALGAAIGQMNECVGNQMSIPPGRENSQGDGLELGLVSGQMDIAKPHSIVVDRSGVRYMNEAGSYMEFCQNMLNRNRLVPAVPSWWIFDEQYLSRYMLNGTMAGMRKPREWFESGYLQKAATVEELARKIEVDPSMLRATLETFNASARVGHGDEFKRGQRAYDEWLGDHYHLPSNTLGTIEKAPFYAAPVVPGDVGTFGGVVTDAYARVLREDGSPIAGLYATGTSTASVMGRSYPGAGSSVGPSFVWGYVAAKHAADSALEASKQERSVIPNPPLRRVS